MNSGVAIKASRLAGVLISREVCQTKSLLTSRHMIHITLAQSSFIEESDEEGIVKFATQAIKSSGPNKRC